MLITSWAYFKTIFIPWGSKSDILTIITLNMAPVVYCTVLITNIVNIVNITLTFTTSVSLDGIGLLPLSLLPPLEREGCGQPLHCLHGVELHHHPGPTWLPEPSFVLFRLRLLVPQWLCTRPQWPLCAWRARGALRWPGQRRGTLVEQAKNSLQPTIQL